MSSTGKNKTSMTPIVPKSQDPAGEQSQNLSSEKNPSSTNSREGSRVSEFAILKAVGKLWNKKGEERPTCAKIFKELEAKFSLKSGLSDDEMSAVVARRDHLLRRLNAKEDPARLLPDRKLQNKAEKWFNEAAPDVKTSSSRAIEYLETKANCFLTNRSRDVITNYIVQLNSDQQEALRNDSRATNKKARSPKADDEAASARPTKRHRDSNEPDECSSDEVIGHMKTLVDGFGMLGGMRDVSILSRSQRVREVQNLVSLHTPLLSYLKKTVLAYEDFVKKTTQIVARLEKDNDIDIGLSEKLIPMAMAIHALAEKYFSPNEEQALKKIAHLKTKLIESRKK